MLRSLTSAAAATTTMSLSLGLVSGGSVRQLAATETTNTHQAATALLDFLQGPDGQVWAEHRQHGWTSDSIEELCSLPWDGVKCNSDNEVVQLDLENTGLVASIPASLGSMSFASMTHLNLSNNALLGVVPAAVASNLPNLVQVNLYGNSLRGELPMFDSSSQLEVLNLGHNDFFGELPPDFGTRMADSAAWETLREINLGGNKLFGEISIDINQLTNLEVLDVSNNNLSGPIPPAVSHLSKIKEVYLHENALSGTVPASLADLVHLENLTIDGNKLTGAVPQELCAKNLNANSAPREEAIQGLDVLTAEGGASDSDDGCSALACPVGTFSPSHGTGSCQECADGSTGLYVGASSCLASSQTDILKQFYEDTNGDGWTISSKKWFDDGEKANVCDWTGVACNGVGDVTGIVLTNANLEGTISPSLGLLTHLELLDLSNNKLVGDLPSELHMAPLQTLDVSGNQLQGVVPTLLCNKEGLNGNGEGITGWLNMGTYECEAIACPIGKYSPGSGQGPCVPCLEGTAIFLASTTCDSGGLALNDAALSMFTSEGSSAGSGGEYAMHYKAGALFAVLLVSFCSTCFLCGGYFIFARRRKMIVDTWNLEDEESDGDLASFEDSHLNMNMSLNDSRDFGLAMMHGDPVKRRSPSPEEEIPTTLAASRSSPTGGNPTMKKPVSAAKSKTYVTAELDEFPTTVQGVAKTKNAWSSGKEQSTEVWLDVPKIS